MQISAILMVKKCNFYSYIVIITFFIGHLRKSGGQKIDLISLLLNRFS